MKKITQKELVKQLHYAPISKQQYYAFLKDGKIEGGLLTGPRGGYYVKIKGKKGLTQVVRAPVEQKGNIADRKIIDHNRALLQASGIYLDSYPKYHKLKDLKEVKDWYNGKINILAKIDKAPPKSKQFYERETGKGFVLGKFDKANYKWQQDNYYKTFRDVLQANPNVAAYSYEKYLSHYPYQEGVGVNRKNRNLNEKLSYTRKELNNEKLNIPRQTSLLAVAANFRRLNDLMQAHNQGNPIDSTHALQSALSNFRGSCLNVLVGTEGQLSVKARARAKQLRKETGDKTIQGRRSRYYASREITAADLSGVEETGNKESKLLYTNKDTSKIFRISISAGRPSTWRLDSGALQDFLEKEDKENVDMRSLAYCMTIFTALEIPIRAGAMRQQHQADHLGLMELKNENITDNGTLSFKGKAATEIEYTLSKPLAEAFAIIKKYNIDSGKKDSDLIFNIVPQKRGYESDTDQKQRIEDIIKPVTYDSADALFKYVINYGAYKGNVPSRYKYSGAKGSVPTPTIKIHDLRRYQATNAFFNKLDKLTYGKTGIPQETFKSIVKDTVKYVASDYLQQKSASSARHYITPVFLNATPWKQILKRVSGASIDGQAIKFKSNGTALVVDTGHNKVVQDITHTIWTERKDFPEKKEKSQDILESMEDNDVYLPGALIDFEPLYMIDDDSCEFRDELTDMMEEALDEIEQGEIQ